MVPLSRMPVASPRARRRHPHTQGSRQSVVWSGRSHGVPQHSSDALSDQDRQGERADELAEALWKRTEQSPEELLPQVYRELRALAARHLRQGGRGHTLQPTALVHEVYLRFADGEGGFGSREHFLAVAARAMRQVLTDHARRRAALKRGGGANRVTISEVPAAGEAGEPIELLELDGAMRALAAAHPRPAKVAELRFFAGLSVEQVSEVLAVSERTVKGDWHLARAWLRRELEDGEA